MSGNRIQQPEAGPSKVKLPHPPRPNSPPLPPRKNVSGLPPTYLNHLRSLLRQWMKSQTIEDDGLPLAKERGPRRLWTDERLNSVERALWHGVILPQVTDDSIKIDSRKGLLEMDWNTWISGAMRRRSAWRQEQLSRDDNDNTNISKVPTGSKELTSTLQSNDITTIKKGEKDSHLIIKSKSVPGTPLPSLISNSSSTPTPSKSNTRPPSIASSNRSIQLEEKKSINHDNALRNSDKAHFADDVSEDGVRQWVTAISQLPGYQRLSLPKSDDWEMVNDDYPSLPSLHRDLPGAFPQSAHYDPYHENQTSKTAPLPPVPPDAPASPVQQRISELQASQEPQMLKPVFCLRFLPSQPISLSRSDTARSSGTVRLGRAMSNSTISNISNDGSCTNKGSGWWPSGPSPITGQNRTFSEMTLQSDFGDIEIHFIPGQFALPMNRDRATLRRRASMQSNNTPRRRRSARNSTISVSESERDQEGKDGDGLGSGSEDGEPSSTWSSTQRGDSTIRRRQEGLNVVIGGEMLDLPTEGQVELVGGTVVVKGMWMEEERQAIEKILKLVLYTIQSMILELELLDAFRIPRESDRPLLPPKLPNVPEKDRHFHSPGSQRHTSLRDRSDKAKGFFQRIGKESRGVLDGLLGRGRRSSGPIDQFFIDPSLPSPVSPSTPMDGIFPDLHNSSPYINSAIGTPHLVHSTDRYLATLKSLETFLPSTSPNLLIPPPAILLRLKEEDARRRDHVAEQMRGMSNAQSHNGSGTSTPTHSGLTSAPTHSRPSAYRLGGDVRVGLGSINSQLDTLENWVRMQRLETLQCTAVDDVLPEHEGDQNPSERVISCGRAKSALSVFYDVDRDLSLSEYLDDLGTEMKEDLSACNRSGCVATAWDHQRMLYHADKKVIIKVEEIKGEDSGQLLDLWVTCEECGAVSPPRDLSEVGRYHSWSKLLELLIYTDILRPPNLCRHERYDLSYHLRTTLIILSISIQPVKIHEARLPKLQVGPDVTKRKPGKAAIEANLTCLTTKDEKVELKEGLRSEVDVFFTEVERRVTQQKLQQVSQSENSKPPNDKTSSIASALTALLSDFAVARNQINDLVESTPITAINDARLAFVGQIGQAVAKTITIENQFGLEPVSTLDLHLPEYAKDKVYALPGSHILIREDEPSSIIAYTLSSASYFNAISGGVRKSAEDNTATTPDSTANGGTTPSSDKNTDTWQIEVKRRDTPRDLLNLNLRSVAKKRSEASIVTSRPPTMALTPNAPSLELSLEQVEAKPQSGDRMEELVRTISKATALDPILTSQTQTQTQTQVQVQLATQSSLIVAAAEPMKQSSSASESEGSMLSPAFRTPSRSSRRLTNDGDPTPPSAFRFGQNRVISGSTSAASVIITPTAPTSTPTVNDPSSTNKESWGSVTMTFTNSFNQLMKLGSEVTDTLGSLRSKNGDRSLASLIGGPLSIKSALDSSLSTSSITDHLPHLQFNYTFGEKLKLGCTVYYATAFDSLRRRCAIDKLIVGSLSRTNNWDTSGGKSKAAFFMTEDKRFVVKELVSKWNVSDTHALLEISPAYFEHLEKTHNKATSLTKIVGFYSIRIHDMQTSNKKSLDLLVMENLFYKQDISKTYDLKGIESRKVPKTTVPATTTSTTAASANTSPSETLKASSGTLFDGEWLDGMTRNPILLHPHAKRILSEALSLDTRFLSSQSIMDYSLLLGLDTARSEVVVGLVDAIGSYNLFKSFESKGKLALNRGGEVTVIPPDQYKERFESAMKLYLLACPDKWSKSTLNRHRATILPAIL